MPKKTETKTKLKSTPHPSMNPRARENQMIALAERLAEQQLMDGTASSQVITHYLKLATEREKLEREKLKKENQLLEAKTEAIESAKNVERLYEEALIAMSMYSGRDSDE